MIMLVFPCAYNASQSDSKLTIFFALLGPYNYSDDPLRYFSRDPSRVAGPTNELTAFTVTGTDNMAGTVSHKGLPGMRPIVNDLSLAFSDVPARKAGDLLSLTAKAWHI
jgi:hypothetical protein